MSHVAIIGGGIVGLSLADALLSLGANVTLVDAKRLGGGASAVATSYLEPRLGETPQRRIEQEAHRLWPDFARRLEADTGVSVDLATTGQIRVATADNRAAFDKEFEERRAAGWAIERLSLEAARALEPTLAPALGSTIVSAARAKDVLWVNGPAVCTALAARIQDRGGVLLENWAVCTVERGGNGLQLKNQNGDRLFADKTIVCTGAAQHTMTGLPHDLPTVRPVRGVNLVLDMAGLDAPIRHLIKHKRGTLCPRSNGHLLVGTTYEHGVTDLTVDEDVIAFLYANAEPIMPGIRELPLLGAKAGLRSKTPDGALALGRSVEDPRIHYSLGHAGSGYLRAPVVADGFARFVLAGHVAGHAPEHAPGHAPGHAERHLEAILRGVSAYDAGAV
ncbi:MAG: FAD-dependent oxidoreductase [Pseudomonadota bacterium]